MHPQVLFTTFWFNSLALFLPVSMVLLYKWPHIWQYLLALFLGVITAIIDIGADEVQFPALLLLIFGFFLGFSNPKHAWRRALILAVWIPLFGLGKILFTNNLDKLIPEGFGAFLAFIPAFAGTYAGVILQITVARKEKV